jgi:hypothetical protein
MFDTVRARLWIRSRLFYVAALNRLINALLVVGSPLALTVALHRDDVFRAFWNPPHYVSPPPFDQSELDIDPWDVTEPEHG